MAANALVVFYSRYGETEQLALAAGVGAIQERANIRLRRLPDLTDASVIQTDAEWAENLDRMRREYIAPREIDIQWADVLILAAPQDRTAEMERFLDSLGESVRGKVGLAIGTFAAEAAKTGLIVGAVSGPSQDATAAAREAVKRAKGVGQG
jgi:multimeric flavodoxin WrbA